MATLKFKIKNGIPPYIVKLKKISIIDGNKISNDTSTTFTQQKVETNNTDVQFNSVTSGAYILEIIDNTKFSTLECLNVP